MGKGELDSPGELPAGKINQIGAGIIDLDEFVGDVVDVVIVVNLIDDRCGRKDSGHRQEDAREGRADASEWGRGHGSRGWGCNRFLDYWAVIPVCPVCGCCNAKAGALRVRLQGVRGSRLGDLDAPGSCDGLSGAGHPVGPADGDLKARTGRHRPQAEPASGFRLAQVT